MALERGSILLLLVGSVLSAQDTTTRPAFTPLPEGNIGIASKYLHDAGIDRDPSVVFADDFEGGAPRFDNAWGGTVLTPKPENVRGGKQALECTLPWPRPAKETGMGVGHHFKEGFDTLHLRYYAKFGRTTELFHGGTHDGGAICARAPGVPDAKPGIPADGRNEYTVLLDTWRPDDKIASPGTLATYTYHPEQRHPWGEHFFPSGKMLPNGGSPAYFGPHFMSRADIVPERDRWACYELMVKANTPGKRDGRIAFWVDGKLTADFTNLRLRDVDTLKANRVSLGLYTQNDAIKSACAMWFDDVVVATSYIGPVAARTRSGPARSAQEMAQGREALARGEFGKAWRHFDRVDSDDLLRDAQDLQRKINDVVQRRLGEAQALESIGEKADAREAYRQILREFQGIPAADGAKARIEAVRAPKPER
jgi:hypothetical protein